MIKTRYILLYITAFLISGCSSQQRIGNIDFSDEYRDVQPAARYSFYHQSADTTILYYSISSNTVLYKKNSNGISQANMSFRYMIYPEGDRLPVTDSTSVVLTVNYDSLAVYFNGELPLRLPEGAHYLVTIHLNDLNRNTVYTSGIRIDKKSKKAPGYYKVTDSNGQPLFDQIVKPHEKIYINNAPETLHLRCYFRNFPIAPPPFATGSFSTFDFHSDSTAIISTDQPVSFSRKGIYFLQSDTMDQTGLSFICAGEDYPSITTADELIHSLRYLTTREEFDRLSGSQDVKKAVDDYWLARAGNNERGRKLIKVYYGRAQEANRLFTSYLEGWKSDRGMIYIIFGPPKNVYRVDGNEIWRYDFSRGLPDVQFYFSNVLNPFTGNDYQLIRDPAFQNLWYMAVDSWRSGRIVGEY